MNDDRGFTLVEVTVVVSILGLIAGVLATAMTVGLRSSAETKGRLDVSQSVDLVASRFVEDASGARTVTTSSNCGPTPLLAMTLRDEGVNQTVAYSVAESGSERLLVRTKCDGAERSQVLTHALGDMQPTIVCLPACSGAPHQITLGLPLCVRLADGLCDPSSNRYIQLLAHPRGAST
jgi:prepilin-type N-terminal cleavage/methylation domain-containing protein